MKIELTPENKVKFLVLHWGQKVLKIAPNTDSLATINDGTMYELCQYDLLKHSYVELNPLSEITDEDAIEFIKLVSPYTNHIEIKERRIGGIIFDYPYVGEQLLFRFKNLAIHKKNTEEEVFHEYYSYSPILHLKGIDFLRSRGYLLPYGGHSCEELIKAGWAKYKQKSS